LLLVCLTCVCIVHMRLWRRCPREAEHNSSGFATHPIPMSRPSHRISLYIHLHNTFTADNCRVVPIPVPHCLVGLRRQPQHCHKEHPTPATRSLQLWPSTSYHTQPQTAPLQLAKTSKLHHFTYNSHSIYSLASKNSLNSKFINSNIKSQEFPC
jgi:hypothetical protein